jgi:chemotaxis protein histidine kinase CheA
MQVKFIEKHKLKGKKTLNFIDITGVVKQMIKVYHQENKVHETVLRLQREILISEEQLVEEFRRLCQHVYSMRENSTLGIDKGLESIMQTFNSVTMDSDWSNFCQQNSEHLVPENAAFRHPDHLQYPNHSHPLLQPIFSARMERRSPLLNRWQEYIYVLTPAGFLHEYHNGRNYPSNPDTSIFVPHYKVSSLSTNLHHNLVFQLQPHKASRNLLSDQGHPTILPKEWRTSKSRLGINDRFTWALRAKSAADMDQWIHHLTQVSNRYTATNVSIPLHMPSHEMTVPVITSVAEINDAQEEKAKEESQATEEEGNNIQETPVEDTPSTSAEDAVPTEEDQAEKPSETETAADVEKPAEEAKEESATDVKDEKPGDDKKEDKSEEEKKPDEEEKKSEGEKKPTEEEKKSDEEKPAEDAVPAKEDEPSDPKTTD